MIDLALSPEEEQKRNQAMQMQQAPLAAAAAPQQQKGIAGQMMDMAKQRAMTSALDAGQTAVTGGIKSALAPTVASGVEGGAMLGPMAGSGAMAGMATAVPYVGAGLMAGKMLGLFNEGGMVGPLNAQYAAGGYQIPNPNLSEARILNAYDKYLSKFNEPTGNLPNMAMPFDEFKLAIESQEAIKFDQGGQVGMTEADARALMNNQASPDQLYDEIVAESMTEAAQQAMPMMRPPLGADPLNADTTYSPYDMIRPDNAPST